jgi:hypothetical protein
MNTTIARHVLCLMMISCFTGLYGQEKLAMNAGSLSGDRSYSRKDTIKDTRLDKRQANFNSKFNIFKSNTTCAIHVVAKDIEEGAYTFEIIDMEGNRVFNEVVMLTRNHYRIIDTSNLPEETYFLIISSGSNRYKKKISI